MTIKWNWATGITLVYIGFVVFMLGMVYMCTQQHFDLVSADYYEQELKFQQVIDGKENEHLLEKATVVTMDNGQVTVVIPMDKIDGEGSITFYRPDNAKYDLTIPLKGESSIAVPLKNLQSGLYKVKSVWQHQGQPYYNEQSLFVP
jgi:hypothetical protein